MEPRAPSARGRRYRSPIENGAAAERTDAGGFSHQSQKSCMMSYRDFKGVMRPGQNKRNRGRNNNGNHPNNRPRTPHRSQTFDSNGPNVKIRGNAYQVFERYVALAREAASSGDRIAAENLYQHAEHYFRIMNADGHGPNAAPPRPMTPADTEMNGPDLEAEAETEGQAPQQPAPPPASEPEVPPTA